MAQPLDDFGILGADFNSCTIDIDIDSESGEVLTSQMKKPCEEVTFSLETDLQIRSSSFSVRVGYNYTDLSPEQADYFLKTV